MRDRSRIGYCKAAVIIVSGSLLGIAALIVQVRCARGGRIHNLFTVLNSPIDAIYSFVAKTWHQGNTDQLLGIGLVPWLLYWPLMGIIGLWLTVRIVHTARHRVSRGDPPEQG